MKYNTCDKQLIPEIKICPMCGNVDEPSIPVSKLEELMKEWIINIECADHHIIGDIWKSCKREVETLINEAKQECDHEFVSGDNQVVTGCLVCIKCKCIRAK